jgi:arginyl-tRNA synthetase
LQYAYARCRALIRKFEEAFPNVKPTSHIDENAEDLAKKIIKIKNQIEISAKTSSPNLLCEFAFELTEEFNNFYEKKKIITDEKRESSQAIYMVYITERVLGKVFDLLGIEKLERI